MNLTIITIGAVEVSVKPDGVAVIYNNGVALTGGNKITNTSTTGDMAVLTYMGTGKWYASTNDWIDGGT
jgi:hypothetical protein